MKRASEEDYSIVALDKFIQAMTQGIGAHLSNDQKRVHLADIRREALIDQVCVQEILPPE